MRENTSRKDHGHAPAHADPTPGVDVSFEVTEPPPTLWELVSSDRPTLPPPDPLLAPEIEGDTMVTGAGEPLPPERRIRQALVTTIVVASLSIAAMVVYLIGWS